MCRTASACITRSRPIRIAALWGRDDPDAGKKYAADVKNLIDYATSGQVAGFIAESIQGVGGCVVFPDGYLKHAYEHVRAAGGVCIADEVQTGLRPHRHALLGLRNAGRDSRHRDDGQRHRQRLSARRGRHHAEDRRDACAAHSLQHLRRQSGRLRAGQGGARSDRAREVAGELAQDGQTHFRRAANG